MEHFETALPVAPEMASWLIWIPLLPLLGSMAAGALHFLALRERRLNPTETEGQGAAWIAIAAMAAAFVLGLRGLFALSGEGTSALVILVQRSRALTGAIEQLHQQAMGLFAGWHPTQPGAGGFDRGIIAVAGRGEMVRQPVVCGGGKLGDPASLLREPVIEGVFA